MLMYFIENTGSRIKIGVLANNFVVVTQILRHNNGLVCTRASLYGDWRNEFARDMTWHHLEFIAVLPRNF